MIDKSTPGIWIYESGREVIQKNAAGQKILQERWNKAWDDADGICCLCEQPAHPFDATLEHFTAKGAGGGKHDDRQGNLGISHRYGNVSKGSQSLEQYLQLPRDVRIRNCIGHYFNA